ncbi:MAG: DNA polymerase III subunit beta [Ruminococcus sp.]|nr:DNA polymerase III subunit beta [Ruminococcus sp.]
MKFICSKQPLYDAVITVSKAVSERSTLPSLEGIRFSLADSLLELTGYDLELGIRTVIAVKSEDKGQFIVNARLFAEMIKKMPAEDILIDVSESYQITLSGGVTKYNLFAVSAEDYPDLPNKDSETVISIPQPVLKSMIAQTKFAVAINDTKPILKGELFDIENGQLNLAAIDGYRLAVRYEPVKYSESIKFVVPSKTLTEIQGILGENDEDSVNIYPSRKHIIFEIGGYMVYSRLLEGDFHPYKTAIPPESKTDVIVDRKELIETLERAILLINDRSPSPVRCFFENGRLRINCSTAQGKISDEINADITGPSIEIGFKCRYLLDPLKVIGEDKIKLQMSGSLLPMKIVPCEGDKYTFLVLPVRLPKEG